MFLRFNFSFSFFLLINVNTKLNQSDALTIEKTYFDFPSDEC